MTEPLQAALMRLRPLLLDTDDLVRAVATGRRRGAVPGHVRAELRPVQLGSGRRVQMVTSDGRTPTTRNLEAADAALAVDSLLAEPFGSWHVETRRQVVQLRVTKRGEAQVHEAAVTPDGRDGPVPTGHDRVAKHLIDPADPLFSVLGADAAKRRQVDAFLRQLAPMAGRLAARAQAGGRPLNVVDLGCGNAYLTFAAHRYLATEVDPQVRTTGVDVRPQMAARNAAIAAELGLSGMSFRAASIEAADGDRADGPGRGTVDIALALHACDTATDDALALAVRWGADGVLAAPCCHHDVQRQIEGADTPFPALTRHAILRERFADVLTDTVRADLLRLLGYRVDVVEFIDSRHTPRNAMIRAVHTGAAPTARRIAEYTDLVAGWQLRPALAERLAAELDPVLTGSR